MRYDGRKQRGIFDFLLLLVLLLVLGGAGYSFLNSGKERIPVGEEGITYHFYDKITDERFRKQYEKIYRGLYLQKNNIGVAVDSEKELQYLMNTVLCDHPELFWVDPSWEYRTLSGVPIVIAPHYYYQVSEREEKKAQLDEVLEKILGEVPADAADYEKIKYIFEYVIESVTYEKEVEDNQTIYSSLVNKESVCSGYAKAVQYLAQKMGMECVVVLGTCDNGEGHAWNIVKLDGEYYQVDATYGDKGDMMENDTYPKAFGCDYTYLGLTDEQMYADRKPEDYLDLPVCEATEYNYYILHNRMFDSAKKARSSMKKAFRKGSHSWKGAFTNEAAFKKIWNEMESGGLASKIYGWSSDHDLAKGVFYLPNEKERVLEIWY